MEAAGEIFFLPDGIFFPARHDKVAKLVQLTGQKPLEASALPGLPGGGSPPVFVGQQLFDPDLPILFCLRKIILVFAHALAPNERSE